MLSRTLQSPWGNMLVLAEDGCLQAVSFVDPAECLIAPAPGAADSADSAPAADRWVLDETERQLGAYFAGRLERFQLPLLERGTAFQSRIWSALAAVPYGQSLSYQALAALAGRPSAVRATGNAVGRNPWVIIVPCHRVLAAGAALGGFSSGLARKRGLLRHEGILWHEPLILEI